MHRSARWLAVAVLLAGVAGQVSATTITYAVANAAGNTWTYSYAVSNGTLGASIREFTLYFDPARFSNLALSATPANWDSLVVQPDTGLPADGFVDALALAGGIAPGGTLTGLSVSFTFLGAGSPGSQPFDVVNPTTFATLGSGTTAVVPLPAGLWLLATGTGALLIRTRRRRRGR